jgi:hypothetical protein
VPGPRAPPAAVPPASSRAHARPLAGVLDRHGQAPRPNNQRSTNEPPPRDNRPGHGARRAPRPRRETRQMLLRKEVIQPHLPVRLPCYDFVPIADPTFDGSLPHGLGHRLRVLLTFVT